MLVVTMLINSTILPHTMRFPAGFPLISSVLFLLLLLTSCVDPFDQTLHGTVNVVVVDGTITNLPEPQIIRLNRSRADLVTGLPDSLPITKATVEVVVDSVKVIAANETVDGTYQCPLTSWDRSATLISFVSR